MIIFSFYALFSYSHADWKIKRWDKMPNREKYLCILLKKCCFFLKYVVLLSLQFLSKASFKNKFDYYGFRRRGFYCLNSFHPKIWECQFRQMFTESNLFKFFCFTCFQLRKKGRIKQNNLRFFIEVVKIKHVVPTPKMLLYTLYEKK